MKNKIEIKNRRGLREKHFLNKDGTITAYMYNENIHYFKNGKYEEIDNTLLINNEGFSNNKNSFSTFNNQDNELLKVESSGYYLTINLEDYNKCSCNKTDNHEVCFEEILNNVDLKYELLNNKIKESIVLKNKKDIPKSLNFIIKTNLKLFLKADKTIEALDENNFTRFIIEAPFMFDSNNKFNYNINYKLKKHDNDYNLKLLLDHDWLNKEDIMFPVIIDPTITNQSSGVYDTYIYPGDTNVNRNDLDILKIGVERINSVDVVNRTLIKFDLPKIGTGDDIISSYINLTSHVTNKDPFYNRYKEYAVVDVHEINSPWSEETANWSNMHDKYNKRIESSNLVAGAIDHLYPNVELVNYIIDISDITKKWYAGVANNGVMLKDHNEVYNNPETHFRSNYYSNNQPVKDRKPVLIVNYQNKNGLENYMTYQTINLYDGVSYINNLTGNLTNLFSLGNTIGGVAPASISLVYNTNDVVLNNNYGYGIGCKINLHQTIEKVTIEEEVMYKYLDEDGTHHYFRKAANLGYLNDKPEENYYDESGLSLTLIIDDNNCKIQDKSSNELVFIKKDNIWYLSKIVDTSKNEIKIVYDNNKRIIEVIDGNNERVTLLYENNKITIISIEDTTILNYSNNKIINLVNRNGTTSFNYNSNNIISKITNPNLTSVGFEYYDVIPYKIKKVTDYGLNNAVGKHISFDYKFKTTTVTDNKNRYTTYTFNNRGNTISTTNLKQGEEINTAFGKTNKYGDYFGNYNKLNEENESINYVNNLLDNVSFEKSGMYFTSNNIRLSISEEYSRTGKKSLKAVSNSSNDEIYQNINVPKSKYYTFSSYIKNDNNLKMKLSYQLGTETIKSESRLIQINDDFNRFDTTIYYDENATSDLKLSFIMLNPGVTYIDDVQLEEGEIANYHNLIDNSNFSKGMSDWFIHAQRYPTLFSSPVEIFNTHEVVTLTNNYKALKIKGDPYVSQTLFKEFNIPGKRGDQYNISFWYKNLGVDSLIFENYSHVLIKFYYGDDHLGYGEFLEGPLNKSETEWQFFSTTFTADEDYYGMEFVYFNLHNANEIYLTNFSLFKNLENSFYTYSDEENLELVHLKTEERFDLKYDNNNQLIKTINPKEAEYTYEYDNVITDRILNGISPTGISNKIKYDEFNNPSITTISNVNKMKEIITGEYYIRQKGTNKYLSINSNTLILKENTCSHQLWNIEKVNENYKIKQYLTNRVLSGNNYTVSLTINGTSLFELLINENGSYSFKLKDTDNYITADNNNLKLSPFNEDDFNQEFYIEDKHNSLFISSKNQYTEDGKFIIKKIDTLNNEVVYDVNLDNGLINSITDSLGRITNYTYNDKKLITSVNNGNTTVNYEYNNEDLLSKITEGTKEYIFNYDEFLNTKSINIGSNITLINNNYENNNGNLINSVYGNNHEISYEYDDYDRVTKTTKMNDTYKYYYDNFSNLSKILSNNDEYRYYYDFSQRISNYYYNDFIINYEYDKNNIIEKKYNLELISEVINYNYDEENSITKIEFDNNNLNYKYDELGRLDEQNINNDYKVKYNYLSKGKRTSLILDNIKDNYNEFRYKYDSVNNITHIYKNNEIINYYEYDNLNQLVKDYDYVNNKNSICTYDNSGNILNKKEYDITTETLIKEDIYEYNNSDWSDQLTKYNNQSITYDGIGNPLTIGNDITLSWINGRELASYEDLNNTINYKYNKDGIRITKEVNNVKTEYFTENNQIIFEKRNNDMLYYIREVNNKLLGFKFNDVLYYYLKNGQEDIIGILDSNLNLLGTYEYDSWGRIISIRDNQDNDISNDVNHIMNINPFRYRSYYYDIETRLYYLNSRYYNSEWCRFINADKYISTDTGLCGYNVFVYANNNSIKFIDIDGHIIGIILTIAAASGILAGYSIGKNTAIKKVEAQKEINATQHKNAYCPPANDKAFKKTLQSNANKVAAETNQQNIISRSIYIAKTSKSFGEYDLKRSQDWAGKTIYYENMWMEPQDVGNYQFGYISRAAGLPMFEILSGAGAYQLYEHRSKTISNCFTTSLCDDPRDTYFIKMGAIAYDKEN